MINLHLINASSLLDKHENVIREAFARASKICEDKLNLDNVDVICVAEKSQVIPEIGIGGYSPNAHTVYLYIDPGKESLSEEEVFFTLVHELHHAKRYTGPGFGKTVLDCLITEGLATAFELELGGKNAFLAKKVTTYKNPDSLIEQTFKPLFNQTEYDYHKLFISGDQSIPTHAGYIAGYKIVADHLKKYNKKASELVLGASSLFY